MVIFLQGWLFDDRVTKEPKPEAIQNYPLIGIFDADGGLKTYPGVDSDSCPTDGTLRPADQHIHEVDAYVVSRLFVFYC